MKTALLCLALSSCTTSAYSYNFYFDQPPQHVVADVPVLEQKIEPEPKPDPIKVALARDVLLVGDSEACMVATVIKDVVPQADAELNIPTDTVEVECKAGTVIQYWAEGRFFERALKAHPNATNVVVFLGTNHYWNTELPSPKLILDQIVDKKLGCTWVGNTAVYGKKWSINSMLQTAVEPTCSYFDTEAQNVALWDGVHPGPTAAKKWLKAVWLTIPIRYAEPSE